MIGILEIALTLFVALMLAAQLIALRFKIPYTLVLVFIGIAITALSTFGYTSGTLQVTVAWIQSVYGQLVDTGLFVGLIVPPLIFEAMMHIRREELKAVIKPALALATIGVLLATIVTGIAIWKLAGISLFTALLFATIISPTDTITVLQIFKRVKVPSKLSTLMDMEAAFNDATAIILFSIILSFAAVGLPHNAVPVLTATETFLYSFVGGAAIGFAVAWLAKQVHARVDDKMAEITLTIAVVYGSYVLATALGVSGLIAVAIVGLYFGNNTMRYISKSVRLPIASFWELAAFLGNTVAFLFIGFVVNFSLLYQAAALIAIAYMATLIARAATVYPTFAAFNYTGTRLPLKWGNIATMGGVRGALSIALVATLASSNAISSADLSTITAMVLGVVFISIIVQAPMLSVYGSRLFGRYRTPHEL